MDKSQIEKIIIALGGNGKVAELCEVSAAAVSQWLNNGIPKYRLKYLKAIKPKIFKKLAEEGIDV